MNIFKRFYRHLFASAEDFSTPVLQEQNGNRRFVPMQYFLTPAQIVAKNKRRDRNKAANKSRKQNRK